MIIQGTRLVGGRYQTLGLVTNGLSMWLDANNGASYSGSGSTWYDLSGNGNDQTLDNSPTYTVGAPSYFSFNGIDQYSTGSTPVLGVNTYTKMIWFQLDGVQDNNLVSSEAGGHYMYFANSSTLWAGNANVPPYNIPGTSFGSATSFSTGTWYCATVVFTSPQIYLYINGAVNNYDITYSGLARGGDGSVNDVVQGLLCTDTLLGIIPKGSGNGILPP